MNKNYKDWKRSVSDYTDKEILSDLKYIIKQHDPRSAHKGNIVSSLYCTYRYFAEKYGDVNYKHENETIYEKDSDRVIKQQGGNNSIPTTPKPKYKPPSVLQNIIVGILYVKPDATEKQIELLKKMHPEAEIIVEEE